MSEDVIAELLVARSFNQLSINDDIIPFVRFNQRQDFANFLRHVFL